MYILLSVAALCKPPFDDASHDAESHAPWPAAPCPQHDHACASGTPVPRTSLYRRLSHSSAPLLNRLRARFPASSAARPSCACVACPQTSWVALVCCCAGCAGVRRSAAARHDGRGVAPAARAGRRGALAQPGVARRGVPRPVDRLRTAARPGRRRSPRAAPRHAAARHGRGARGVRRRAPQAEGHKGAQGNLSLRGVRRQLRAVARQMPLV
jgi:hypothetical protein